MSIQKNNGKWLVDLYPNGRSGKRVRRSFDTRIEAQRFEKYLLSQSFDDKDWNPSKADQRSLLDLIQLWYESHGRYLKAHIERLRALTNVANRLGNPVAKDLSPALFMAERAERVEAGISKKTCNNELGYINAVFNELERTGVITYTNPLRSVRPIKLSEKELAWLTSDEIKRLLSELDKFESPHAAMMARLCLSTGARWGEIQALKPNRIRNGLVTFVDTKSKKNRSVPISKKLFSELDNHFNSHSSLSCCPKTFKKAIKRSKISLPEGQLTHVLRHTFASHFMMNGGNILTLQKILGHSSIIMTMRYSHLAPDYLNDAVKLNPIAYKGN